MISDDLRVVRVVADGTAARAGLQPGDRVEAIDGRAIGNLTDYLAVMKDPGIKGRKVEVVVRRAGKEITLPVGVAAYPAIHRTVFGPILGALVLVFGLYVHLRKPRDPAAGLYLLLSVCLFVVLGLSSHLLRRAPSPLLSLLWGTALAAVVPLNLHFYLVFPERKRFIRARSGILAALYLVPGVFLALLAASVAWAEWALWRGLDSGAAFHALRWLFLAYFVAGLATCPAFVASLVHSFVRATTAERKKQVQVLLIGAIATFLLAGAAVAGLVSYLGDAKAAALWPAWTFDTLYGVVVLATVILPLSMAVAILKYRLWDLEPKIQASLIYIMLVAGLVLIYSLVLGLLGWVFGRVVHPTSSVAVLVFLMTIAVAFEPLRRLLERGVDRAFNPEAHLHRRVLRDFSREVVTIRSLDRLASRLCDTLAQTLAPGRIAVLLKAEGEAGGWKIAASVGVGEAEKTRMLEVGRIVEGHLPARAAASSPIGTGNGSSGRPASAQLGRATEPAGPAGTTKATGTDPVLSIFHKGKPLGRFFLGAKRGGGIPAGAESHQAVSALALRPADVPAFAAVARAAGIELLVPILDEGKLLGWLCLGPKEAGGPYPSEDCHALETLANQLALAVANASSFEVIEDLNQSLKREHARNEGLRHGLQAELGRNERLARDLRVQLTANEELNASLRAQLGANEELNRGLEEQLTTNEELRHGLEAELARNEDLARNLQAELTANEKLTADLRAQLTTNEVLNSDLQAQLVRNEELNGNLEKQLAEKRDLTASLGARLATIEAQKLEILRLQDLLLRENRSLKERLRGEFRVGEIVGGAAVWKRVMEKLAKIAVNDVIVLILGETGTGKELIAKAIHANSRRAREAFLAVNTAMVSEQLLLSELFGHEKGAFTGAFERRIGRFEQAEGGTIFLDEIGDISPATQIALLRVLQTREFQRLGGTQTLTANVRVIAATNRDLERAVHEGRFREDLYYRLKVVTVELPPLRDRPEDIRPLAIHFLRKYARKHGKPIGSIDEAVIERFRGHRWPGNVREMENVIEHAVVLSGGEALTLEDISAGLDGRTIATAAASDGAVAEATGAEKKGATARVNHKNSMDEIERGRLIRALEAVAGNKTKAARSLGMSRATLVNKLKRHGLF